MFAVVQLGSTQYLVREKEEILVDRLPLEEGKNYMFDRVLLYAESDAGKALIGMPHLENVKVEARVMGHEKGQKIRVFKMRSKKRTQRTVGSRPFYTRLKVLKISVLNGVAKPKKIDAEEAVLAEPSAPMKPMSVKKVLAKKVTVKKAASRKGE